MFADASRRRPKGVLFVVVSGAYSIGQPAPSTSRRTRCTAAARTRTGCISWVVAYSPAIAAIRMAANTIACCRSLSLGTTAGPPCPPDCDEHRDRGHCEPAHDDQGNDAESARRQGIDIREAIDAPVV